MLEQIITFLKVLPGLAMFPLSYVLGMRKIGQSAEVTYTISKTLFTTTHINWLLVRNRKDKPLEIQSIHAVIDKDIRVELIKHSPPIVIKSLESQEFHFEGVSHYHLTGYDIERIDFTRPIEIYIITSNSVIKCPAVRPAPHLELSYFGDLHAAYPIRNHHRGRLYDSTALYAIDFHDGSADRTSILLESGIVFGDPPLNNKKINPTELESDESTALAAKQLCVEHGLEFQGVKRLNLELILQDEFIH